MVQVKGVRHSDAAGRRAESEEGIAAKACDGQPKLHGAQDGGRTLGHEGVKLSHRGCAVKETGADEE